MRSWAALTSAREIICCILLGTFQIPSPVKLCLEDLCLLLWRKELLTVKDRKASYWNPPQASTAAPVATGSFASCHAAKPPLTLITFLNPARCRRLQAIMLR